MAEGYKPFLPKCGRQMPDDLFRLKILAQRGGEGDENQKSAVTLWT
jgi:hypothetical protein